MKFRWARASQDPESEARQQEALYLRLELSHGSDLEGEY